MRVICSSLLSLMRLADSRLVALLHSTPRAVSQQLPHSTVRHKQAMRPRVPVRVPSRAVQYHEVERDWTLQNQLCAMLHAIFAAYFSLQLGVQAAWEEHTCRAFTLMLPHCATSVLTVRRRVMPLTALACVSGKFHTLLYEVPQCVNHTAVSQLMGMHLCVGAQLTKPGSMHRCTDGLD